MDYPRLREPIVMLLAAAICLILAWEQERWPDWVRIILVVAGVVLLAAAGLELVDWVWYAYNARLGELMAARAQTERAALVEVISRMTPEQISVMSSFAPVVEVLTGLSGGPIYQLRTQTGLVPLGFVEEFLSRAEPGFLAPVRSWGEGTTARRYAEEFTGFMCYLGFAEAAAGSRPARWIDEAGAMAAIGIADTCTAPDAVRCKGEQG
jgi:hypothetical protein